jgi:hypothetical protein
VEPSGPHVRPGIGSLGLTIEVVATAAAAGGALVGATSSGDVLLLGALTGFAALDLTAGVAAVLVAVSVLIRWGSSSLAALAGAQAVVGSAAWHGSPASALAAWCAGVGVLLLAAGRWSRTPLLPVACGVFAADVMAGPAVSGHNGWIRIIATFVGIVVAFGAARVLPARARFVAVPVALAACVLAALA